MSMASNIWRLIPLLSATGAQQMAIDRWLLDQHYRGLHPPTLRFYTWSPVAISLGYHQHTWPPEWETLTWQGHPIDLVRRPTGGRAVLHQGDLTYAIVTTVRGGDRCQTYRHLCQFLLQGWQTLGVELRYGTAGRGYHQQTNCFEVATAADLVLADGTKLIGSAQLRRGQCYLQHGSLRLNPDSDLWATVFRNTASASSPPSPAHPTSACLAQLDIETIVTALCQAAINIWNITLQPQPLSEQEWIAINQLLPP
ncbi:lipoate--protein ligase family protein [Trichothermofontia sichuanensis B231]|uniref:lipoate--protein ligase family protein n=1 Tax=Trichothermofontia sichuanensis TaxID=3045816 RepID=UPI00224825D0|nr:biotin/lipoate A/B protein ligase family protein [Trichothermofontia sichuanensis]UZQ53576.1 lipoate--protein ligase family protein [Trichothermofontia sichuanensis B231]